MSRKALVLRAINQQIENYVRVLTKSQQKLDYNERQNVVRGTPCSLCALIRNGTDGTCNLCPWNLFAPEGEREEFKCEEVLTASRRFTSFWDVKAQLMHSSDKDERAEARAVIKQRVRELKEWKILAEAKDDAFFTPRDAQEAPY